MLHRNLLLIIALLLATQVAHADVRLPDILADHMVLQQNAEIQLWGWAFEGETLLIESSWGVTAKAVVDAKGEWRTKLKTPAAQTLDKPPHPQTITITSPGENSVQLQDLLIGELWVCSGQSNMAMILGPDSPPGSNNWFGEAFWKEESKHADRPSLRLFNVEKSAALAPRTDCKGVIPDHIRFVKDSAGQIPYVKRGWQPCTPETATYFSAVAYYFGAAIQEKLNVPVGLITCPVGGTSIEPWISLDSLCKVPSYENAHPIAHRNGQSALFNGMIAPLTPLKIRGAIWYQGESSVGLGARYAILQKALIQDWRQQFFDATDMPFYLVQLPPFGHDRAGHSAILREAQATALQMKNTGLAITNDIAEPDNIHPKNKRYVGQRLALQALAKTYNCKDVIADGPTFDSLILNDGKVHVTFRNATAGLASRDNKPLTCFELAGPDGRFQPAQADIDASEVIVSSPGVPNPQTIRFAWGDGDSPNLMSKNNLPAAQFQAAVK